MTKPLNKLLSILITILLVIQPLSGSITKNSTTIQASNLNANGNITINSNKGIQILSGKDTLDYEYENKSSSLGSLLTKEQIETLNKAKIVSSLINANEVNLISDKYKNLKGTIE